MMPIITITISGGSEEWRGKAMQLLAFDAEQLFDTFAVTVDHQDDTLTVTTTLAE